MRVRIILFAQRKHHTPRRGSASNAMEASLTSTSTTMSAAIARTMNSSRRRKESASLPSSSSTRQPRGGSSSPTTPMWRRLNKTIRTPSSAQKTSHSTTTRSASSATGLTTCSTTRLRSARHAPKARKLILTPISASRLPLPPPNSDPTGLPLTFLPLRKSSERKIKTLISLSALRKSPSSMEMSASPAKREKFSI